jgi:hypothetical protein
MHGMLAVAAAVTLHNMTEVDCFFFLIVPQQQPPPLIIIILSRHHSCYY